MLQLVVLTDCDRDWTDKNNNNEYNNYNLEQHIKRLETAIRKREILLEEEAKKDSSSPINDVL